MMRVGDLVMVHYYDHVGSVTVEPPAVNKSVGWVCQINIQPPAHIVLAHDSSDDSTCSTPYTTILKGDIIKIKRLKEVT